MFDMLIEKLSAIVDFCSDRWQHITKDKRGEDDFSGFLWIVGILLIIIDIFAKKKLLLILGIVITVYGIFRCFSSLSYHEKENELFHSALQTLKGMIKALWQLLCQKTEKFREADKKQMIQDVKEKIVPDEQTKAEREQLKAMKDAYYIFECPGCKQKVRIPNRGKKGRVAIVCPSCQTRFIRMRW